MFAHRQYTRKRNCAARSDKKPLRTELSNPGWFRVRMNRSYPEGKRLLLCISTVTRQRRNQKWNRPMKDAERRDKMSASTGKDTWSGQDP